MNYVCTHGNSLDAVSIINTITILEKCWLQKVLLFLTGTNVLTLSKVYCHLCLQWPQCLFIYILNNLEGLGKQISKDEIR